MCGDETWRPPEGSAPQHAGDRWSEAGAPLGRHWGASGSRLLPDLVVVLGPFQTIGERELKRLAEAVLVDEVVWEPVLDSPRGVDSEPFEVPLPVALAGTARFPFAGRSAHLEQAWTAWKQSTEGRRQIVLLSGEPGMGKTRLATEVARRAHAGRRRAVRASRRGRRHALPSARRGGPPPRRPRARGAPRRAPLGLRASRGDRPPGPRHDHLSNQRAETCIFGRGSPSQPLAVPRARLPRSATQWKTRGRTAHHELPDLLGALEDVHGLPNSSSRFTRVRDLRLRPLRSVESVRFRRVLVPEVVPTNARSQMCDSSSRSPSSSAQDRLHDQRDRVTGRTLVSCRAMTPPTHPPKSTAAPFPARK